MEIYATKISDIIKEKIDELCLFVSSEKKSKIERFINKEDKIRALIAEILIRTIIVERLGINNKDIIFNTNKYGKPYLKDYKNFNFNISHSGNFVICAVDDKLIGIDIEQIKHIEFKEIAERFFSLNELKYISEMNSGIELNKFYEIWTLKESYIKCCGKGLSIQLDTFSINMHDYKNIKVITGDGYDKHIFKTFDIESNYKMAICSMNGEIPENLIFIEQDSLIKKILEVNKNECNGSYISREI